MFYLTMHSTYFIYIYIVQHQSYNTAWNGKYFNGFTKRDQSDNPLYYEHSTTELCHAP